MKKHLLKFVALTAIFGLFLTTSCKKDTKEEESKIDLTTSIVGIYTNKAKPYLEIVVTRIDNSTISITLEDIEADYNFKNVKMNSISSFTLNEYTEKLDYCPYSGLDDEITNKLSGSGSGVDGKISIAVTENLTSKSGNCDRNPTYTFTATR
jgi:hypothetical protein